MAPAGVALLAAAVVSVTCHIRAEYHGPRWQVYLCKPLTTTLLLGLAAAAPALQGSRYQLGVCIGLALSLGGDIFLMLPRDRFLQGLACFLAAHLAYLAAFTSGIPLGSEPWLLLPAFGTAVALIVIVWPGLGHLRAAVLVYAIVILLMVWRAWARGWELRTAGSGLAAAGATLFMASDALLAFNRFRRPFRAAEAAVMTTYVGAQALIAASVGIA